MMAMGIKKLAAMVAAITLVMAFTTTLGVSAETNMLANGDFESYDETTGLPTGWEQYGTFGTDDSATTEAGISYNGTRAYKLVTTRANIGITKTVAVEPETTYKLSVWSKLTDEWKACLIASREWDGSNLSTNTKVAYSKPASGAASTAWYKYTTFITTSDTARSIQLRLETWSANTTMYYDDFCMEKVTDTPAAIEFSQQTDNAVKTVRTPDGRDIYMPIIRTQPYAALANGTVTVSAFVMSTTKPSSTLVACVYETIEGVKTLKDVSLGNGTLADGATEIAYPVTATVTVSDATENTTVEAYLWNSASGLTPLTEKHILR